MATFISEVDSRIKLVGNNGDYYSPLHYVAVLEIEGKLLEVGVVRNGGEGNFLRSCGNRAVPLLLEYLGSEEKFQAFADELAEVNEGYLYPVEVDPKEEYGYIPASLEVLKIGVCKGRHEMPCDFYIFGSEIKDPTDVKSLELEAEASISALVKDSNTRLEIYITGLTVAVIAVLKTAIKYSVNVVAMHYDTRTGKYYEQKIL